MFLVNVKDDKYKDELSRNGHVHVATAQVTSTDRRPNPAVHARPAPAGAREHPGTFRLVGVSRECIAGQLASA